MGEETSSTDYSFGTPPPRAVIIDTGCDVSGTKKGLRTVRHDHSKFSTRDFAESVLHFCAREFEHLEDPLTRFRTAVALPAMLLLGMHL